jgi:hypothetical protein
LNKYVSIGLTLLGVAVAIFGSVFMAPGDREEVYTSFKGLDRISPTHLRDVVAFQQCDNYLLDSKNEENPRYSTMSPRPGITNYLSTASNPIRGLFHYQSPGGDDLMIACSTTSILKQGTSSWTTLQSGMHDSPWEGILYSDPDVTRLYLCNGVDDNQKYISSYDRVMPMQNQDDEVAIGGSVTFTNGAPTAVANATSVLSLEAGNYIKYSTAGTDIEWDEIASIEGTTLIFTSKSKNPTGASSAVVRSSDIDRSRYVAEYDGHVITAYSSVETSTSVSNTTSTIDAYGISMAYGIAQSFEATANQMNIVRLKIYQYDKNSGNIILKIKDSLAGTGYAAKITYPISSLPESDRTTDFNFGVVPLTIGKCYWLTIERENSSAGYFQMLGGTGVTGSVSWTYNPTGFDSAWATGQTTIEVSPLADEATNYYPIGNFGNYTANCLYQAQPAREEWSFNPTLLYTTTYTGWFSSYQRKSLHHFYLDYGGISTEASNWDNVKFSIYKTSATTGEVKIYRKLTSTYGTWGGGWTTAGCSSPESDYTATNAVSNTNTSTLEGWLTFEVTSIARVWTPDLANNYGILLSAETTAGHTFKADGSTTNKPKWTLTTATGKTETGKDLYFEIIKESGQRSTVNYSRRFKPENFPILNTFQIPGRAVGIAKTGGYLVVAGKDPDNLHFYRYTGDDSDGSGIEYVTSIHDLTFGSSKSVAYLPVDDSFIFFSGLGVYHQRGMQNTLVSGQIREEAKLMGNYRDPREYYAGQANSMPQATVLPTKDLYLLACPSTASKNSYVYAYNYANGFWTRWTGLYPTAMTVRRSGASEPRLYMGFDTGQVYTLDTSGSTTEECVLEWSFGGADLTKEKYLGYLDLWTRADNPLTTCRATLETSSPQAGSSITSTATKTLTLNIENNTSTDAMRWLIYQPALTAREFKLRFTQKATAGGLSLRTIRYKYRVK